MTERVCIDCGKPVSRQSKKGRCKSCSAVHLNSTPEFAARRAAGQARYYATPGVKERHTARLEAHRRNQTAEERARRREFGLQQAREVLARPDVRARSNSPEALRKRGASRTNNLLGWCPPELRDEYRQLCASKRFNAAGARYEIEKRIPGTDAHRRVQLVSRAAALAPGAADYLRRDSPVLRCTESGALDRFGSHWLRGRVVMTALELVDRAIQRGWGADAYLQRAA